MAKFLQQLRHGKHRDALAGGDCRGWTVRAWVLDGWADLLQQLVSHSTGHTQEHRFVAAGSDGATGYLAVSQ